MVVAGGADLPGGCSQLSALARYNTDGSLDGSFGSAGWVFTAYGPSSEHSDVVIQQDGKILAAGSTYMSCISLEDFTLARYNSDGSPDLSFGIAGKVITDLSPVDELAALAIQPNGKILVAGMAFVTTTNSFIGGEFAVARYLPDGTLDSSFGSNGWVHTAFQDIAGVFSAVLQSDGKLVVAGHVQTDPGGSYVIALARYKGEYDLCVQDDTTNNFLMFNSITGEYMFVVCPVGDSFGFTITGTATVSGNSCSLRLQDSSHRFYRLGASVRLCGNGNGSAVLTRFGLAGDVRTTRISDSDVHNNTCACFSLEQ